MCDNAKKTDLNPLSHFFLPWTRPSRKLSDHSAEFFASPPPRIVAKYITPRSLGNPEFNLYVFIFQLMHWLQDVDDVDNDNGVDDSVDDVDPC